MAAIKFDAQDIARQLANLHEDKGPLMLKVEIPCTVLATITVILRLWSRRIVRVPLKWDDYTIVLSLVRIYRN